MNSKKIVITGASGFLGQHLVERVKNDKSYTVFALTSRPDDLEKQIGGMNIRFLNRDAVFGGNAEEILRGAVLINCAYPRNSSGADIADGLKYIQSVFMAAAEKGITAIINISSQSVYSSARTVAAREETPVYLDSIYATGKYTVELILEAVCKKENIKHTNLRMASLIGPELEPRIVNRFVKQIKLGNTLKINDGHQVFGFLDVEDAVSAIMKVVDNSHCLEFENVYNVGPEKGYTLIEIADNVRDVCAGYGINTFEREINKSEDIYNSTLDSTRFAGSFGWKPGYSLKETIQRIVERE